MRSFTLRQGWGQHISLLSDSLEVEPVRLYGHLPGPRSERPRPGDTIRVEMKSGRVFVLQVRDREDMRDPPDMFFLRAGRLGYADQIEAQDGG